MIEGAPHNPTLVLHIAAGALAIGAGAVALIAGKGGRLHRVAGDVFVTAMLAMAAAAITLSLSLSDWANFPGGMFALYLALTGWSSVFRNRALCRSVDHVGLALGGAVATSAFLLAFQAQASTTGLVNGKPAPLFAVVAALAGFAVAMDVDMLRRDQTAAPSRIRRHIWRMCAALFLGTGSFFLGQQQAFPTWLRGSEILFVPALAPLALMVFWLARPSLQRLPPRPLPAE